MPSTRSGFNPDLFPHAHQQQHQRNQQQQHLSTPVPPFNLAIDPNLVIHPTAGNTNAENPPPNEPRNNNSHGSPDSEEAVKIFYGEDRPREHRCPFPACTTHGRDRATKMRRDTVKNHLLNKIHSHDDEHPLMDPLWDSPIVQFYLMNRPPKMPRDLKRKRHSDAAKKWYGKRVREYEEKGQEMKDKFDRKEISAEEYERFLIGAPKVRFQKSKEIENAVREQINMLRDEHNGPAANAERIGNLEAALAKVRGATEKAQAYRDQIVSITEELLSFWNDSDGNGVVDPKQVTRRDFESLGRGFTWPSVAGVNTFYEMAAYLWPVDAADEPWDDSSIRQLRRDMDRVIEDRIRKCRAEIAGAAAQAKTTRLLELAKATFNASCDMVRDAGATMAEYGGNEYQDWHDGQRELWSDAQTKAFTACAAPYGGRTPLEIMDTVDQLSELWYAHKSAQTELATAEEDASGML